MSTSSDSSDGAAPSRSAPSEGEGQRKMEELRRILLRPSREALSDLDERVVRLEEEAETPDLTGEEVGEVLPEAVQRNMRDETDRAVLADALSPTIERTLHTSIERDPQSIVDAIFPVIGPAIRKSVSEALNRLLTNVNETIEHSFSLKGLRWRWEAWRTGRPFAEVVLRHTLLFRVEQLFLIDRETGLPMQHLTADAVDAEDESLVSGMLTAIQDFVHDSFEVDEADTLQDFSVGELSVWVDHGPHAALAAVIRGTPDPQFRDVMHQVTEQVHRQFRGALAEFDGDDAALDDARPVLEQALRTRRETPGSRPSPILWVLLLALLAGLGWWGYRAWTAHQAWDHSLERLESATGVVVTETGSADGRWTVAGLHDPLALHPDSILRSGPLDSTQVQSTWRPYRSLEPELLLRRAKQQVEQQVILFETGTDLQDGQQRVLDRLSDHLLDLYQAAQSLNREMEVQVRGHHSVEGPDSVNRRVAKARADLVVRRLRQRSVPEAVLNPVSDAGPPIDPEAVGTEEGRTFNRGVTLHVEIEKR
jgi:outer membrane protein OmpA-like peptidoglycan-associated protein